MRSSPRTSMEGWSPSRITWRPSCNMSTGFGPVCSLPRTLMLGAAARAAGASRSILVSVLRVTNPSLHDLFGPVFQRRFNFRCELVGQRAVDQPVIEGQRQIAHGSNGDRVLNDDRLFFHGADAQDGYLRLVDYRRREHAAETAEVV